VYTGLTPQEYGAEADGRPHPLSERFATLAEAQEVYPFARSLGEAVDRHALQKCLDAAVRYADRLGRLVLLPRGEYCLDAPLIINAVAGLVVQGAGGQTRLVYSGNTADFAAALNLACCQGCTFADFTLHAAADGQGVGVRLTNCAGGTQGLASTDNRFRRVNVERFATGCLVWYDQPGGAPDANNDLHAWEDCAFNQYTNAGVHVIGGQAHFLRFLRCGWQAANARGTHGLWCQYGAYFHLDQCCLNGNEFAVRADQFFPGVCTVTRCNGEGNRRILTTSWQGGHAPGGAFVVENCRWAMASQAGDHWLDLNSDGPFSVRGNAVAGGAVRPELAVRYGCPRLEHVNNRYAYDGPWTDSAVVLPDGGAVTSLTDADNFYSTNP
jgi:hypothetical protein